MLSVTANGHHPGWLFTSGFSQNRTYTDKQRSFCRSISERYLNRNDGNFKKMNNIFHVDSFGPSKPSASWRRGFRSFTIYYLLPCCLFKITSCSCLIRAEPDHHPLLATLIFFHRPVISCGLQFFGFGSTVKIAAGSA